MRYPLLALQVPTGYRVRPWCSSSLHAVRGCARQAAKRLTLASPLCFLRLFIAGPPTGPYMYPLYSSLYEFADRTVAALFVFGFTAGGVSAPYVGKWADK